MTLLHAREGVFVDQRRPCDCMRGAVATYLGLPYEQTPDISGRDHALTFWSDWAEWLASIGAVMATFACAPGHLQRWIAIVGQPQGTGLHAVVMSRTELLHDPAPAASRMAAVGRDDVLCAMVIGPLANTSLGERRLRGDAPRARRRDASHMGAAAAHGRAVERRAAAPARPARGRPTRCATASRRSCTTGRRRRSPRPDPRATSADAPRPAATKYGPAHGLPRHSRAVGGEARALEAVGSGRAAAALRRRLRVGPRRRARRRALPRDRGRARPAAGRAAEAHPHSARGQRPRALDGRSRAAAPAPPRAAGHDEHRGAAPDVGRHLLARGGAVGAHVEPRARRRPARGQAVRPRAVLRAARPRPRSRRAAGRTSRCARSPRSR